MGLISRVSSRTYRSLTYQIKMEVDRTARTIISCRLISLCLLSIVSYVSATETCSSPGFNSKTLTCSTCDEMKNFQLSDNIISTCKSCCKQENNLTDSIPKFKAAELLICN